MSRTELSRDVACIYSVLNPGPCWVMQRCKLALHGLAAVLRNGLQQWADVNMLPVAW